MPKSFSLWPLNTPGAAARAIAVLLVAANLAALYFVLWPPGGSPSQLRQQAADLRAQLRQNQLALTRTTAMSEKIGVGRTQGDEFLGRYFLPRRTAYSAVLNEIDQAAATANIKAKESAWSIEPVEGSDDFSMMQISANFEGAYPDLLKFVNLLDKSDGLLIIESLNATPQVNSKILNVALKLDTFVREDGSGQ